MSSTDWSKFFKGIRFRLTLVYSTLFGLFLCAFAYIITNQYFQSARRDFDARLLNYAIDLSEHLIPDKSGAQISFGIPESEIRKAFPFVLNETFYAVRSMDGEIIGKSHNFFPFDTITVGPALSNGQDYAHGFHSLKVQDAVYRAINLKVRHEGREIILQVATPFNAVISRERTQLIMTAVMIPVFIIVSSFFSFLSAGNALNPIKALTDTANSIAARNLSLRVPEAKTGDEVEELGKTFNNLLDRLEKSFKGQEHFVANASHQLNTPLAIIKGELDVLESKPRTPEEHQKYHKSLREELERLIELVKNMLLVSRVESGLESFVWRPVRLDDLLLGVTSRLRLRAKEKNITLRFNIDEEMSPSHLEVMGEKQLLDSLFENLLDNALKYSPPESTVQLAIKSIDSKVEVWMQDEGPGMKNEHFLEAIQSRFKRGEGFSIPGTGIGLSIAHKIALFHHAEITYRKMSPAGSLFIVKFT